MKTKRRDFLKLGLSQALALGITQKSDAHVPLVQRRQGPSILQGATDDTKTQFNILSDNIELDIFVTNSQGQKWLPDQSQSITFPDHPKKITKVFFSQLLPNETFFLNLLDLQTQQAIDVREFQTLDLNKSSLRFAICSCMRDREHDPNIWINMFKNKPDMLFFIGDSVYADEGVSGGDGADPSDLWKRFCEARTTLEVYYSKKLIPIFATWDDHDFGLNNGTSRTYSYVKESQINFLNFFAQDESHCGFLTRGPGVSSALKFRNHLFVLLDDRSYRENPGSEERYAHWGQEQEEWMLNLMRQNPGPSWLMNGSQYFPSAPWKESVSGDHPVQFSGFLKELQSLSAKVIFVSGDVHYSEISHIEPAAIGYDTFELTSSSIHSRFILGSPDFISNDRRVAGTGGRNYILVDTSSTFEKTLSFKATSYAADNNVKFQMDLEV
ncbi:MAG: hypothetical protein ACXVB4_07770 [Pseudobdellovibrionaceae bacterium]